MAQESTLDVFSPKGKRSPESRIWAAAHLEDLPIVYEFDREKAVEVKPAPDGRMFRLGFTIVISPTVARQITVRMRMGASSDDMKRARELITNEKAGYVSSRLWTQRATGDRVMTAYWEVQDGAHYDELYPCDEAGCVRPWHDWIGGERSDPCALEAINTSEYMVTGNRFGDEWEAGATIHYEASDLQGSEGLRLLRDLANDYAWMLWACDALNGAPAASGEAAR